MKFLTALDALIHLLHAGFVWLSWWCRPCTLPEKCFSSTADKGCSVERTDLKHWLCRCHRASALQSWEHLTSRAWLCCPHGLIHEDLDARVCTGLGLGLLLVEGRLGWQDHTWKMLLAAQGSICRGLWLLSAALHLKDFLALGTIDHLILFWSGLPDWEEGSTPGWGMSCRCWWERYRDTSWELCVHSLRWGISVLQPFQKGFSISSLHVWFSACLLQFSLLGEDSEILLKVQKN